MITRSWDIWAEFLFVCYVFGCVFKYKHDGVTLLKLLNILFLHEIGRCFVP